MDVLLDELLLLLPLPAPTTRLLMPERLPLLEPWRLLPITPGPLLLATLLALITLLLVLPQPLRPLVEELDDDDDEDEDDDEQEDELAEELDETDAEMG